MISFNLFRRDSGHVIGTRGPRHHWALGFVLAVILLLSMGVLAGKDAESDTSVLAAGEVARAMEEGRALGRAQMQEQLLTGVLGAWQAGVAEGRKSCPAGREWRELRAAP